MTDILPCLGVAQENGEPYTIQQTVGEAIGRASVAWSEPPNGVFDSDTCSILIDNVMSNIDAHVGAAIATAKASWNDKQAEIGRNLKEMHAKEIETIKTYYQRRLETINNRLNEAIAHNERQARVIDRFNEYSEKRALDEFNSRPEIQPGQDRVMTPPRDSNYGNPFPTPQPTPMRFRETGYHDDPPYKPNALTPEQQAVIANFALGKPNPAEYKNTPEPEVHPAGGCTNACEVMSIAEYHRLHSFAAPAPRMIKDNPQA